MPEPLTAAQLEALKQFITPTVSNAIELFGVRRRTEGFMLPGIECRFPELGAMVGYAATVTFRAWEPGASTVDTAAYYAHVLSMPAPRVLVAQDLDEVPIGALVGEVNSSVHRALGCVGHVTNGGVRDLDECRSIGFHLFSGCVQVAHAYVHLEGFGEPVQVGGVTVSPGDLLHADQHGVCLVPHEVAPHLAEACREMEALERPLIELARSPEFTPQGFLQARAEFGEQFANLQRRYGGASR
ncbi:MAG: RraA family protein [Armatimonadetes bacterium]|nr:RraA family protein [Armatimonadota bacterium]